jgi:CubicO group peptidase (beta-lactamase class C family)
LAEQWNALDLSLHRMANHGEFSGVVLIERDNERVYAGSYGYANRSFDVPISLSSVFGHASVTKLFTAVSVLQLAEAGALGLDMRVADYLNIRDASLSPEVTAAHLLTHTSGLADYFDDDDEESFTRLWRARPNYSMCNTADFLPLILGREPIFGPGEKWSYCNAGYILLGLMIERASGLPYRDYVRRNVFERAGMPTAGFAGFDEVVPGLAEGYEAFPGDDGAPRFRRNVFSLPAIGGPDGARSLLLATWWGS